MIKLTAYKSKYDNKGLPFAKTWEHIVSKLNKPKILSKKDLAPLVSPTIYIDSLEGYKKGNKFINAKKKTFQEWIGSEGDTRITDDQGKITRSNKNVIGISMLVFDFDEGSPNPEAITSKWQEFNYCIHSTWSHKEDAGRYRLIVPLKKVLTREQFKNIWDDVAKVAGRVDVSCKDPSRMFYWPSCSPDNVKLHYFKAVIDKKFYAPKIKKFERSKFKRGDYCTLDVVKWFVQHEHYLGNANKVGQHWVRCPWQDEHQGDTGPTDAFIFEAESGAWPTFSCSHSTCRKNERNITQVINVWGDADNYCKRALTRDAVKTETKIKCLGYDDSGYYYYQAAKTNHVVRLKANDHRELNFYSITADIDYWFKSWGKEENGRVDWKACARDMMSKCHDKGFFRPTSVRGAGCWWDESRVVVHMGNHLRVGNDKIALTEFKSDFIYESSVQVLEWRDPLPASESFRVYEIINALPIPDAIEKFLFSGHCVSSILSGCLRWRPHIWVVGDSGSGKTTIINDVLHKLWGPVSGIFNEGRTTESGVRQKVRHNAVPIILDEVESNTKEESQRVESLVAMARSASSNSAADVAKGTISGHGLSFLVKSCFTFSSVAESLQWAQDKERFLVVQVKLNDQGRSHWPVLRREIEEVITKEYALRFFSRAAAMAPVIRQNCDIFHEAIIKKFPKSTSRNADQIGTHAACAWSLRSDKVLTIDQAIEVLLQYGREGDWSRFWAKDETSSGNNTLDFLLSCHLRGDAGRNWTVGELVRDIHLEDPTRLTQGYGADENDILQRYGLMVDEGFLWVSKTNSELKKIFTNSGLGHGFTSMLRQLDGGEQRIKSFTGIQAPSIGIPLNFVFRDRELRSNL